MLDKFFSRQTLICIQGRRLRGTAGDGPVQSLRFLLTAVNETLFGLRDLCDVSSFDQLLADTAKVVAELDLEELAVPRQRKPPVRYTGDAVA